MEKLKRKILQQTAGISSCALQEADGVIRDVDVTSSYQQFIALKMQEITRDAMTCGMLAANKLEDEL